MFLVGRSSRQLVSWCYLGHSSFSHETQSSNYYWYSLSLYSLYPVNLDFQVLLFGSFLDNFHGGVFLKWYCYTNRHTLPEFLVLYDNTRSVGFYFPVSLNCHVPENSYIVILGNCVWLVIIPSLSGFDFVLLAYFPGHICRYLVMSVSIFIFGSSRHPEIICLTFSSYLPQILHFGLVPSLTIWQW